MQYDTKKKPVDSADDPTHEGCFGERRAYVSHSATGAIAVGAQEVSNWER
jgi:hypothetical protein